MKIPKNVKCIKCGKKIKISGFDSNMPEQDQIQCFKLFQKTIVCEDCEQINNTSSNIA